MKYLIALFLMFPAVAFAEPPTVLMLPAKTVVEIRQYLDRQPYGAVADLVKQIEECASLQLQKGGVITSHGQCPEVYAAMTEKPKEESKPKP